MKWSAWFNSVVGVLMLAGCATDRHGRITAPSDARSSRDAGFSDWATPLGLGPLINSAAIDQQPTLSKNGLTLYFTSGRPTEPGDVDADLNIWVARRACTDSSDVACDWQAPQLLGPEINTPFADVSAALSRDEHHLIFASQRLHGNCTAAPCDRDLWVSYRENVNDDFGWQEPVNLGPNVNGSGEDLAPSYFENADGGAPQLFFTRGIGAVANLWFSELQSDGSWGPASEIGELNSPAGDARPSISHNGLEIYFWSSRTGTPQIYYATRDDVHGAWSAPAPLPEPIAGPSTQQPFIYSHGNVQTLFLVRGPAANLDVFMSERTRGGGN